MMGKLLGVVVVFLVGCSTPRKIPAGKLLYTRGDSVLAENKLAMAAESVSKSLSELADIEKTLHPTALKVSEYGSSTSELTQLVTLDWSGPVENLLERLAKSTGFRFQVIGKVVGVPILVTLSVKNTTIADVLRNLNLQCGYKANVVVDSSKRLIELRYVK